MDAQRPQPSLADAEIASTTWPMVCEGRATHFGRPDAVRDYFSGSDIDMPDVRQLATALEGDEDRPGPNTQTRSLLRERIMPALAQIRGPSSDGASTRCVPFSVHSTNEGA